MILFSNFQTGSLADQMNRCLTRKYTDAPVISQAVGGSWTVKHQAWEYSSPLLSETFQIARLWADRLPLRLETE